MDVKVYSAAKTVADCFQYQSTVGFDVAIEALRDALEKRKAIMVELIIILPKSDASRIK